MKSITIHNIESPIIELIEEQSRRQGISLNRTIKNLLMRSLGITDSIENDRRKEFLELFGTWSKKDEEDFNQKTLAFEKIDKRDWL